jgi:hypothetical protein
MVARDSRLAQIVKRITRDFMDIEGYAGDSGAAMKDHSAMSEIAPVTKIAPVNGASACCAARCSGIREGMLLTVVLYALVRASQALAGDHAANADARHSPDLPNSRQPLPSASLPSASLPSASLLSTPVFSTDRSFADSDGFSATEFRPRSHVPAAAEFSASENFASNTPMLEGTSVWQKMSEYKSQDRVRVLTLWETAGSTLSLQAGKRGAPSLQWSSRRMNRDGATRGLLDRLVSAALRNAANRDTGLSPRAGLVRSVTTPATLKPLNGSPAAGAQ